MKPPPVKKKSHLFFLDRYFISRARDTSAGYLSRETPNRKNLVNRPGDVKIHAVQAALNFLYGSLAGHSFYTLFLPFFILLLYFCLPD